MNISTITDFSGVVVASAFRFDLGKGAAIVSIEFRDTLNNCVQLQLLREHLPAFYQSLVDALTPHLNAEMLAKLEAEEQTTWPDLPVPNAGTDPKEKPE